LALRFPFAQREGEVKGQIVMKGDTPGGNAYRSRHLRGRLLHAAANLGVAAIFLTALLPWAPQLLATLPGGSLLQTAMPAHAAPTNPIAAWIWITCALVMAVLSLTRTTPREARTDYQALVATLGMFIPPLLMRPMVHFVVLTPIGMAFETIGVIFQLLGLILMQVARLYLGRRFGLLPANRGLVIRGPFRLIRHPIYAAWILTAGGTSMAVPTIRNFALAVLTIPFMVWRIALEEELLDHDPQYLAYRQRVRWRLVPGIF
jgi:protein-S-isoprenylcysteine O-methyltransferase Ste14